MFKTKKKKMESDHSPLLIAIAVVSALSTIFVPYLFIFILQESIFYSKENWYIGTPWSAYFIFAGGLLWISLILTVYLILKNKLDIKIKKWIVTSLLLFSFVFFTLGVSNYYVFKKDGLYYNHILSVQETHYGWDEFVELVYLYEEKNGITELNNIHLVTQDGKVINIRYDHKFRRNRLRVIMSLQKNDVVFVKQIGTYRGVITYPDFNDKK